jgi:hypothetical protein
MEEKFGYSPSPTSLKISLHGNLMEKIQISTREKCRYMK